MDRKIYLLLFGCLGLWSCQKEEASEVSDAGHLIYLSASVEGTQESRAPYAVVTPSREHPLMVDVWASTTENKFSHTDNANGKDGGAVALHTTARFTNGSEQLLDAAVYPQKDGNKPRALKKSP